MKRLSYNLSAVALVLLLSGLPALASAVAGMLRSNGGVSVNGSPVTPLTTVFAGDRIETAPKAVGNITVSGSSLLLEENSSMVFTGQEMDFYCGGGTIQTTQGVSARYGRVEVKPSKDSARYRVQQTGATLKVSAVDGDLTLSDGGKSFSLPAGNSMNVFYSGCAPQVAKSDVPDNMNAANGNANPPAPQSNP